MQHPRQQECHSALRQLNLPNPTSAKRISCRPLPFVAHRRAVMSFDACVLVCLCACASVCGCVWALAVALGAGCQNTCRAVSADGSANGAGSGKEALAAEALAAEELLFCNASDRRRRLRTWSNASHPGNTCVWVAVRARGAERRRRGGTRNGRVAEANYRSEWHGMCKGQRCAQTARHTRAATHLTDDATLSRASAPPHRKCAGSWQRERAEANLEGRVVRDLLRARNHAREAVQEAEPFR